MLRRVAFIGQMAVALVSWLGIGSHGAVAHHRISTSVAADESAIADRMERARERLTAAVADPAQDSSRATQLAQWFNWPNWSNWFNGWRNF
jgi:hypothetical protein